MARPPSPREITHEVYTEEQTSLADRTLNKVGEFIGRADLEGAAAVLLDYQRKRDALWDARVRYAARLVKP